MDGERTQRLVIQLLDDAEQAFMRRDWGSVIEKSRDVLALDPDNQDAKDLKKAAERARGTADGAPSLAPRLPVPTVVPFAGDDTRPTFHGVDAFNSKLKALGFGGLGRTAVATAVLIGFLTVPGGLPFIAAVPISFLGALFVYLLGYYRTDDHLATHAVLAGFSLLLIMLLILVVGVVAIVVLGAG